MRGSEEYVDQNGQIHSCESYVNLNRKDAVMTDYMIANSQYERCVRRAHANGWVTPETESQIEEAKKPSYRDEEERLQLEQEVAELKKKIRRSRAKRAKDDSVSIPERTP